MRVDATVKRETKYIAAAVVILSMLMEAVFLILRIWDYKVVLGNVFGGCAAVLNFFLLVLTLQKAVTKSEKDAAQLMKVSQTYRMLALFAVVGIGFLVPVFNGYSTVIPLFFPRIAIAIRGFKGMAGNADDSSSAAVPQTPEGDLSDE